ncbi:MAG: hypothetical protein IJ864_03180 [Alphaproteobacteria bacterium]|nr:hypothetical protein [Alphaproteobacteria bacterium]
MAEDISRKELHNIINRAIAKCGSYGSYSLTSEINIYCERYKYRQTANPQLNIFEETVAQPQEMLEAKSFCEDLDEYKKSIDLDAKEETLPESFCRRIYQRLAAYEPYIFPENQEVYNRLRKNIEGELPENKEKMMIEAYLLDIEKIERVQKEYAKEKRKNKKASKEYLEKLTLKFFKDIQQDEMLKECKASPEKMSLFEKSVNLVKDLPLWSLGRIARYELKVNIYNQIQQIAEALGDKYKPNAITAQNEAIRFQNAIQKTINIISNPIPRETKHTTISTEAINKIAQEEWLYK